MWDVCANEMCGGWKIEPASQKIVEPCCKVPVVSVSATLERTRALSERLEDEQAVWQVSQPSHVKIRAPLQSEKRCDRAVLLWR